MRAATSLVKPFGNWPPRAGRGSFRVMGKLLMLLLIAAVVAVFLVPLHGKTLWQRAGRRGLPHAAALVARGAFGWFAEALRNREPSAAPSAQAQVRSRRAPEARTDRIVKAPPKERLSSGDRASLDRLVVDARSR